MGGADLGPRVRRARASDPATRWMQWRHPWSDERERRSVEDARPCTGGRDRGDSPRLPAAGEGEPPRRRGRVGTAAVPCHPGRVGAARHPERAAGPAAARRDRPRRRPSPGERIRTGQPGRADGRRPAPGRPGDPARRQAGRDREPAAGGPRRRVSRRGGQCHGGGRRGGRRRIEPIAPAVGETSGPEQGDAVLDVLRPGRRGALRARLERGELVRLVERHLLDDQPEGVRRSAQARTGVPATGAARGNRLDRGRGPAARMDPGPARPRPPPGRPRPRPHRRAAGGGRSSRGAGDGDPATTEGPGPPRPRWGTFHRPRPPIAPTRVTGSRSRRPIAGSADHSFAGRRPASAGS